MKQMFQVWSVADRALGIFVSHHELRGLLESLKCRVHYKFLAKSAGLAKIRR